MNLGRSFALLAAVTLAISAALAAPNEAIVSRIKREPVLSSNVASIGYSPRLRALEIEFTRGAIYRFLDVPRSVYRELMASDSKGHFIAQNLRGQYQFARVRPAKEVTKRAAVAHR